MSAAATCSSPLPAFSCRLDHLLPVLPLLDLYSLMQLTAVSKGFNRMVSSYKGPWPSLVLGVKRIREATYSNRHAQLAAIDQVYDNLMTLQPNALPGVTKLVLDDIGLRSTTANQPGLEPWLTPERRDQLLQAIVAAAPNVCSFKMIDGGRSLRVYEVISSVVQRWPTVDTFHYHHHTDKPTHNQVLYTAEGGPVRASVSWIETTGGGSAAVELLLNDHAPTVDQSANMKAGEAMEVHEIAQLLQMAVDQLNGHPTADIATKAWLVAQAVNGSMLSLMGKFEGLGVPFLTDDSCLLEWNTDG